MRGFLLFIMYAYTSLYTYVIHYYYNISNHTRRERYERVLVKYKCALGTKKQQQQCDDYFNFHTICMGFCNGKYQSCRNNI